MGSLLWLVVLVLAVMWALGAFVVNVGGGLIHLLLVIVLLLVIYNLFTGRRRAGL